MNAKNAKKIRKMYKVAAEDSISAFQAMVRRLTFRKRVILAWKILWNLV